MADEPNILSEATLEASEAQEQEKDIARYEWYRQVEQDIREGLVTEEEGRQAYWEREHSRPPSMRP